MGSRLLTSGEIALARTIYGNTINYEDVRIHDEKYNFLQGDNVIVTPNGEIYYPVNHYLEDNSTGTDSQKALFIHEMGHVLQDHNGANVILQRILDGGDYNYDPIFNGTLFHELPMEAQAEFLEDLYRKRNGIPVDPDKRSGTLENSDRDLSEYEAQVPFDLPDGNQNSSSVHDLAEPNIPIPPVLPGSLPQSIIDLLGEWGGAKVTASPLVLDLDGQGIDLASVLNGVYWDIDQDGFAEKSGWISGNDGLLAIDLNGDGIINDHGELFGTQTTDGFTILSAYDSNADNVIDASDAQFGDLLVWVDANSNGYSESTELYSLTDLGITSINLNDTLVDYDIAGNNITNESTFTINGQTQTIVDAWFAYDNTNSYYATDYTLDIRTLYLPTLRGFGDVADLHIAMSMDETLLLMVQEIAVADTSMLFDPTFDFLGKIEAIMYQWTGVDNVDPTSRGINIDARALEFLETYVGEDFFQHGLLTNPDPGLYAANAIMDVFHMARSQIITGVLAQIDNQLFGINSNYNLSTGTIEGHETINNFWIPSLEADVYNTGMNDVYLFDAQNYTGTIINELGGTDQIILRNVLASDIRFEAQYGQNLKIYTGAETITVDKQFFSDFFNSNTYDTSQVESLLLDDGTVIDLLDNLTFAGTSANDSILGLKQASVTFIGEAGDDTFYGGENNDSYVWSVGDGNDIINETGGVDQLVLHSVLASDIRFEFQGFANLKIYIGAETITISNQFYSDYSNNNSYDTYQVESILLDDGTVIDLLNNLTFAGTDGNDSIGGLSSTDDILVGGLGNDYLYGKEGDDTYIYALGDGNDTILETSGNDVIAFGTGITLSDLTFSRNGAGLQIDISDGSNILVDQFYSTNAGYIVEQISFDDGSVYNLQVLVNTAPNAVDDSFIGDQDLLLTGNVLVNNGSGADSDPENNVLTVLTGTYATTNGSVTISANGDFTYTPNAGYNGTDNFTYTIDDGFGGNDTATVSITVRPPNVAPVAQDDVFTGDQDINIAGNLLSNNGNGADSDPDSDPLTVVAGTYATANGSVTISSNGSFSYTPNTGYVGADSFTYTLQDDRGGSDIGTANITLNALANNPNAINGTSANDTLNGDLSGISNDTLIGYGGDDTLNGKLGNDSYDWTVGDGNDVINEAGGVDQLVLHNVLASDIRYEAQYGYNLKLYIGTEIITINKQFYSDYYNSNSYDTYQVESVLLDDGTVIDIINNMTFAGTSASDSITGLKQAGVTFIGGAGNDTLNGNTANDSYVWSVGDGNDTINETGGLDQLVLHNVLASDIRYEAQYGYNLKLYIGAETITINKQFYSDYYNSTSYDTYQVESVLLDDGTVIDILNNMTFAGTSASDTINGLKQAGVTFVGGAGNDTLNGYTANDIYEWSVGDGNDTINETGGVDQLVLHGVLSSEISLEAQYGYNLKINIGGETITVNKQYYSDYYNSSSYDTYQVENILLDDGTVIDLLNNLTFTGTLNSDTVNGINGNDILYGLGGSDTLNGKSGDDVLNGGKGVDTINGGDGNDSYDWTVGDGNDIINEAGGVADQLVLHNVLASDIRYEAQYGYNLKLYIGAEIITINKQFYSDYYNSNSYDTYQVESVLLDDGTVIDILNNMTFAGTSASDSITGLKQAGVTFVGGAGNDTLNGNAANDSYVWSVGDGNDAINETGGLDQLVLHGVLASDIRYEAQYGYNLKLYIGTETITINKQFYSDYYNSTSYDTYQVESVLLDDGTVIDILNNMTFAGTSASDSITGLKANDILYGLDGDDYLYGNTGDDVLYGGSGIDQLYGQGGADTFVFEAASAFTSSDNVQDFKLSDNDVLDISDLLTGYDPLTDAITDFVQITESGTTSYLSVDANGGADNFVQIASLFNQTGITDEDALVTSGNLLVA